MNLRNWQVDHLKIFTQIMIVTVQIVNIILDCTWHFKPRSETAFEEKKI